MNRGEFASHHGSEGTGPTHPPIEYSGAGMYERDCLLADTFGPSCRRYALARATAYGLRRTFPAFSLVNSPSRMANFPFTSTYFMPWATWCGFSKVAMSRTAGRIDGLSGQVNALAFLPDGRLFAAGGEPGLAGEVGVWDVATDWGMPERNRDFGLTLGNIGVPAGPYLIIPFGGSSALRDLAGSYVDGYFSPLRYVGNYSGRPYVGLVKNLVGS